MEQTDQELLQEHQRTGDAAPLQALIGRYLNQVYSSAVRQVHDRHLAEDVTQAVFILFSQKAAALPASVIVPGWLFRTARYVSLHAMKKQSTRLRHEQHAARPERVEAEGTSTWQELSPSIDHALSQIKERYRDALTLRFFQNMSLAQVGQAMGVSEEAARKLVDRGLEKLRGALASSGVACTEAGLVAALSQQVIEQAPAHLAQWAAHLGGSVGVSSAGAGASTNALALTKGAVAIMATTKVKVAVAVIVVAAAVGGGTVAVKAMNGSPSLPAPVPVAQPAAPAQAAGPAGEREVIVREVRDAAIALTMSAVEADVQTMESITLVEAPEYKEMADAVRTVMEDSGKLRKLMLQKLGAVPEEMQMQLPGGPEVFRKQYLPNAPVRFNGDTAMIDVNPGAKPPVFVFRKDNGKWKLAMGQSFCGGKPEKANQMTMLSMRLGEVVRSVTDAVNAGECASAKDAAELFQSRLQGIAPQ